VHLSESQSLFSHNNHSTRQSVGNDSHRQTAVHGNSVSVNFSRPYEDPRGTIEKVIIDGDTKHNTPNRYIRSRPSSVNQSATNPPAFGSARSIGLTQRNNALANIQTPVNSKGMKDSNLDSNNQANASWRKAGSRSGSQNKNDQNSGSVSRHANLSQKRSGRERENSKTKVDMSES